MWADGRARREGEAAGKHDVLSRPTDDKARAPGPARSLALPSYHKMLALVAVLAAAAAVAHAEYIVVRAPLVQ